MGKAIRINDNLVNLDASIHFNAYYQTIISLPGISREEYLFLDEQEITQLTILVGADTYFSVFGPFITKSSSKSDTFDVEFLSSSTITGKKEFHYESNCRSFIFEITDGVEIIGLCPYDLNSGYIDILLMNEVRIPVKRALIKTELSIGEISFYCNPTTSFNKDTLSMGFIHGIYLSLTEDVKIPDLQLLFEKFSSLFEVLSGEIVTVNKLYIVEGEGESHQKFEYIGLCNFPKKELNVFHDNSFDSSGFIRQTIFKISDFEILDSAINTWLSCYDNLQMANKAYQRILLDEDVKIVTHNRFLAAMQEVEGYANAFADESNEKAAFTLEKQTIIDSLSDEAQKNFIRKYCQFIGQSFRKSLKDFTYESLKIIKGISKSTFDKEYDDLIEAIKDDRDIYTHSSNRNKPKLNSLQLMEIAYLYKQFYRINLLKKLGVSRDNIKLRFSTNRTFSEYLKRIFNLKIDNMANTTKFDKAMWHFSQRDQ